jgi:hypothetical protein
LEATRVFTFEEMGELLDEAAHGIPPEFYNDLNGGVNLLPDVKYHEAGKPGELFVLGEYRHDQMGRYIVVYYGSVRDCYPALDRDDMRRRLKKLLLHEFTHHLESLAGEHSLEDKDSMYIRRYRREAGRE